MKKLMHILILSCKKATELIEKKLFIGINTREKVQLYVHKSMCDACKKYAHQSQELDTMLKNHVDNFAPTPKSASLDKNKELKKVIIKSLDS